MNAFGWFGVALIAVLILFLPVVHLLPTEENRRRRARALLKYMTDGRPPGCKCPPNPGSNALPCDSKHIGSRRCPITPKVQEGELAQLRSRVAQLELALSLLGEVQRKTAPEERAPDISEFP